ncbi:FliH/SctL family protein [Serpentinicella sp. ANB-PHB4]|uniref:FliH/SctL family protein n=1 Tax=Serpentinicella sp. ANB-PHB4 TaxID=3074076 RepID=UPI00285422B9|nr:FliH/SctL family protein [Serpentinicella sp. ANB-PHB4]MDR5658270.1 FliH/SctL family protein [Serpentinicella sp. ANB-PHB4]
MSKVYKSQNITLGHKKSLDLSQPSNEQQLTENDEFNLEKKEKQLYQNIEVEKNKIISDAKKEASDIIEDAENQKEIILQEAREQGYKDGLEAGKKKGYNEYQSLIDDIMHLKQKTYKEQKELAKKLEEDLIQLVIDTIKKVAQHELDKNHEFILNLIRTGIEKCTFRESLLIRVSESDFDHVNEYKNLIYAMAEGIDTIELKCDKSLNSGDVIIETLSGKIDCSIQAQIQQIESTFNDLLKSE